MVRAFAVAGPKYDDSLPLEPGPVRDTVYPLSLRKIWRYLTSMPVELSLSTLVKTYDGGNRDVVVRGETHGFVIVCVCGASLYLFRASLVSGP